MTFSSGSSLGTLELQLTANQAALHAQLNQTRAYATQVARDIERQINRAFSSPPRTSSTQLPGLQNAPSQGAAAGASAGKSFTDRFMSAIAPIKGAIDSIFNGTLEKAGASAFSSVTSVIGSAVDAAKGFAGQIFNVTKDFQGFESSLKTFLKGNQQEIDKFVAGLEKFAATTPYELKDLQSAAIQNLATGAKPDQIIKDLKTIGDVAAGANAPLKDLMEVYAKSRTEGKLQNEDIAQFTGRGVQLTAELAKMLGASQKEVTQLASDGKLEFRHLEEAMRRMSAEGGAYFDAMKNKATTLEGKLSNVSDTFYQFQKQLGQSLEPLFSTITDFLGQLVSGLTNNKDLMGDLKGQAQGLASYFKQNPEIAENLSNALNELVRGAMSAMVAAAKQLGEYLKQNPRAIQDAVSSGIALGREIGGVVTSTASLVSNIVQFTKGVKDAAIAVRDVLGGAIKALGIGDKKDNPVANFLFGDMSQQQADLKNKLYPKNALSNSSSGSGIDPITGTVLALGQSFFGGGATKNTSLDASDTGEKVFEHAMAWVGKDFKKGVLARCADFVRTVLESSELGLKDIGITKNPIDAGLQSGNGSLMARSFFGKDIGQVFYDKKQARVGDLVGFRGTYGEFKGTQAISHVGIYAGNNEIIDRSTSSKPVRKRSLDTFGEDNYVFVRPYAYGKSAMVGDKNPVLNVISQVIAPIRQAIQSALSGGKPATNSGDVLWGKAANYAPSDLSKLTPAGKEALEALKNPNVRAWLDSVAIAENGAIANTTGGYGVLVGSESKDTFDPNTLKTHPRRVVGKGKNASTATGRYQTMDFVWDDDTQYSAKGLGLADFKPQSQEILAVGRMKYRKILDKVMAGDIEGALQKRSSHYDAPSEWASLEGNPYNQGTDGGKRSTFLANFRRFRNEKQSIANTQQYGPPLPTSAQLANTPQPTTSATSATGGNEQDHRDLLTARRKLAEQKYTQIAAEYDTTQAVQDAAQKQQRELDAQRRSADDKARVSKLKLGFADAPDSESKKVLERTLQQQEINHKYDEDDIKYGEKRDDLINARNKKDFVLAESKRRQNEAAKTETDPKRREEKIKAELAFSAKETGTDYSKGINQLDQLIAENKELRKIELETATVTDSTADKQAETAKNRQQAIDTLNRSSASYVDSLKLQESLTTSEPTKQKLEQAIALEESTHGVKVEIIELKNTLDDLNERKTYLLGKGGLKADSQEIQQLNKEIAENTAKIDAAAQKGGINLKVLENQYKQTQTAMQRTQQIEKEDLDRSTQLSQLNREMSFAKTQQQKAELQAQISKISALGDEQKQLQPLQQQYDDLVTTRQRLVDEGKVDTSGDVIKSLDAEITRLNNQIKQIGIQSKNSFEILGKESQKAIEQASLADMESALSKESGLVNSKASLLSGQAKLIQGRGGNEYRASALEGEASQMQEQIRYKQELLQIEQQIAAARGTSSEYTATEIGTMKANAEALNQINLSSISGQVKTLGKDLMDVSKNALGGFFTDIITGSKSAGDAFKDLIGNIANQLAQLAVNQLISGIFGGGGGGALGGGGGGGGFLGGLLGFNQGGMVPNYASGGSVGAIASALQRERAASGRTPLLAALTPGEMVLTVKQAKRFQELKLEKVLNFNNGGVVGGVSGGEIPESGMTINIPVSITGGAKETSVDVPRLQSSIRGVVVEELLKQQRPGGALNR
ncbi:MAG: hypothetical protein HWQ38_05310 [Nostoc sp. NMS7]|uniref:tape measure protein n=1 Tax=Nostoc sp. NMS7 TaxID=2815391 RepID=UPI0026015908|nr:tape measure protein [Nostoc sp. NMS7]MBN3945923.1 hypothetical protein [Nostoc sp. NMS7]